MAKRASRRLSPRRALVVQNEGLGATCETLAAGDCESGSHERETRHAGQSTHALSHGGTQAPPGSSVTRRPEPVAPARGARRARAGPARPARQSARPARYCSGRRRSGPGGRHKQRRGEALRSPLVERSLLQPDGHLEGVQRQRAGEAHRASPSSSSASSSSAGVEVDLVCVGEGDRPALVADQLHVSSRRGASGFTP
jgi:hypothetical protein